MNGASRLEELAFLNLMAMLRRQAEFSREGELCESDDAVMAFGGTSFPAAPFNVATRKRRVGSKASRWLDLTAEQFRQRRRRFSIYAHDALDRDLQQECLARGYLPSGNLTTMVLTRAPQRREPVPAVEVVGDRAGVERFARIAAESFVSVGLPPAVTRSALSAPEQLLRSDVRLVTCNEQAAALSIVHAETAGIYWVGTVPAARGRGLARNCALALAEHAFSAGARCVVVQAGQGLESFYATLGFQRLSELRLYTNLDALAHPERRLQ